MQLDVKVRFLCLLIVGIAAVELSVHAVKIDHHDRAHDQRHALYPGNPPGQATYQGELPEMMVDQRGRYSFVHQPVLDVYHAQGDNPTGAAVVICPGGGYGVLAYETEGIRIAEWLSEKGITGILLRYRMHPYRHPVPMMDVQRALQLARANASDWSIDPQRVGVMGFSAGGHLASTAAVHHIPADPFSNDPALRNPSRPDFAVLVYPVITMHSPLTHLSTREHLLGPNPDSAIVDRLSTHRQVSEQTPPTLLVHARDDDLVPIKNSELFFAALKKNKVRSKLLTYDNGGHGFGLGRYGADSLAWPAECLRWLGEIGMLEPGHD